MVKKLILMKRSSIISQTLTAKVLTSLHKRVKYSNRVKKTQKKQSLKLLYQSSNRMASLSQSSLQGHSQCLNRIKSMTQDNFWTLDHGREFKIWSEQVDRLLKSNYSKRARILIKLQPWACSRPTKFPLPDKLMLRNRKRSTRKVTAKNMKR